jgi:hypothetical protein
MGDGFSPAHIAIDNGDESCLRTCLQLRSDSEVRNYKSETPLQMVYVKHHLNKSHPMVSLLKVEDVLKFDALVIV